LDSGAGRGTDPNALDPIRRRLDVAVAERSAPARMEITIGYSGESPREVVGLVNLLAEQYAGDLRASAEAAVVEASRRTREEREAAGQDLLAARSGLDGFLQRHFQAHHDLAEARLEPPADVPEPRDPDDPPLVDNPAWLELARQHRALLDRRAELLATRTVQHPLIGDLDRKIADLQRSMEGVPRQIADPQTPAIMSRPMIDAPPMAPPPDNHAGGSPSVATDRADQGFAPEQHGQAALDFFALRAALQEAQSAFDGRVEAERQATERRLALPGVEIHLAQEPEPSGRPADTVRLALVALASGLAMAAGASMTFRGLGSDPPLETVAQAQAALPVPLVGAVPGCEQSESD
jgi:hypothetical protein